MSNEQKGAPALSCRRVMIPWGIVAMFSRVIGRIKVVDQSGGEDTREQVISARTARAEAGCHRAMASSLQMARMRPKQGHGLVPQRALEPEVAMMRCDH